MAGRKAYPFAVMEATNDINRLAKEELDRREANEQRVNSNYLRCLVLVL